MNNEIGKIRKSIEEMATQAKAVKNREKIKPKPKSSIIELAENNLYLIDALKFLLKMYDNLDIHHQKLLVSIATNLTRAEK